jgi:hypothetical protein
VGVAGTADRCSAQIPAVPVVPVAPAVPGAIPAVPGAAAPGPRVGFFQRFKTNVGGCIQNLLGSPLGQLLNNATKPLSALTGGVIPTLEKKPTTEQTKEPGAGGAAATGKKDAAEAKKRQADVKYLGTLDCRYYPDASKALADALRTDPSECVRYEAALALGRGCCCSKVTVAALEASVSGFDRDGNPAERSARVRCAAAAALERCLACYVPTEIDPEPACAEPKKTDDKKETPPTGETAPGKGTDKEKEAEKKTTTNYSPAPSRALVERAYETLAAFQEQVAVTHATYGAEAVPSMAPSRSLYSLWQGNGNEPRPAAMAPPVTQVTYRAPQPTTYSVAKQQATVPFMVATAQPMKAAPQPAAAVITPAVATTADPAAEAGAVEAVCVRLLRGTTVSDQHTAIRELVRHDWKKHPIVASALVAAAKSDAASEVRVDCIRHLTHYQMVHRDVLTALAALSTDSNGWIRDEATKAHQTLSTAR